MTNHYATLGVSRDASLEDIRAAYRKLALKCHPDKGGSNTEFNVLKDAYDVLQDTNARARFDREYFAQPQQSYRQNQGDAWSFRDSTAGSAYRSYRGTSANFTNKGTSESWNNNGSSSRPKARSYDFDQSNFHQTSNTSRTAGAGPLNFSSPFGSNQQNYHHAPSYSPEFLEKLNTNAAKAHMNHSHFEHVTLNEIVRFSLVTPGPQSPSLDKNLEAKLYQYADHLKRRKEEVFARGHKSMDIQKGLADFDVGHINYDTDNIKKMDQLATELVDAGMNLLGLKNTDLFGKVYNRLGKHRIWLDMSGQLDDVLTAVLEEMRQEADSTEQWETIT